MRKSPVIVNKKYNKISKSIYSELIPNTTTNTTDRYNNYLNNIIL